MNNSDLESSTVLEERILQLKRENPDYGVARLRKVVETDFNRFVSNKRVRQVVKRGENAAPTNAAPTPLKSKNPLLRLQQQQHDFTAVSSIISDANIDYELSSDEGSPLSLVASDGLRDRRKTFSSQDATRGDVTFQHDFSPMSSVYDFADSRSVAEEEDSSCFDRLCAMQ